MRNIVVILMLAIFIAGCLPQTPGYEFKYETIVGDVPANIGNLNTAYDDYNSDLPYPAARCEIFFSTTRISSGENFDIICKPIDMSYHEEDDILNFTVPTNTDYTDFQFKLLSLIISDYDQLGPLTFAGPDGWDYFFFSDNESGNFDIKFVYTLRFDWGIYEGQQRLIGPADAVILNSDTDDLYPAVNADGSVLYFCSNREDDQFDIYSTDLGGETLLHDYLSGSAPAVIVKESVLSGESDEKCPSITGDLMVFASDREGGYGGFDLYYSRYLNGSWSSPVNFGEKINSAYDEYRPITFLFNGIRGMIFSSDRPGGKGGFDLYAVRTGDLPVPSQSR